MDDIDVVVIGAGPAGETVAGRCADGGLSVVSVERRLVGDDSAQLPQFEDKGVMFVRGSGRIAGDRAVDVVAVDGSRRRMTARWAVVLATGTSPAIPRIDGLRGSEFWDNQDATAAKDVPERLLVIGGGFIGAEMAQAFRRLGCREVTVVVGATFTGPGMQELLHSATIAIVGELPLAALWQAVPPFPTVSEVWLALLETYGL
jgi:dihydrolipoamide dehydrogenase